MSACAEADGVSLERGVFTISIDTELGWGCFDRPDREERWRMEGRSREVVTELLRLFERYEIPATWAVVGHLFLSGCGGNGALPHPEITRPEHKWLTGDWYQFDPCSDAVTAPLWYAPDLIEQLLRAQPEQEIASHSFAHVIFGDPGCSAEAAEADIAAARASAEGWRIPLRSFVYPRNRVEYTGLLPRYGFTAYRGPDPQWYRSFPRPARRLAHYLDDLLAIPPPTVTARRDGMLWNIPGSVMLQGMDGIRRWIPGACRTRRGISGLRRAARSRRLFHLWFHPINFAVEMKAMLDALEPILAEAARLRDEGRLDVLTMGSLADRLSGSTAPAFVVRTDSGLHEDPVGSDTMVPNMTAREQPVEMTLGSEMSGARRVQRER